MGDFLAFTADQVERLTGLTRRQLSYWDRTGFFPPHYTGANRRSPYSRIYSFRDVVGLRAIALLRNSHHVPLQELRKVGKWLADHYDDPWASLTFYVQGRAVFFDDPVTGLRLAGRVAGQAALPFPMERIAGEVHASVERLRQRSPEQIGRVERHRYVVHNAPVLAGTRIPTSAIWDFHQAGYDTEAILREYPQLTPEDVHAAIADQERRQQRRTG